MGIPDESGAEFDMLRKTTLALERLQRSPPEPIVLVLAEFADTLGCSVDEIELVLARLADLSFIEGPGAYGGAWLFRRLTRRGRDFVDEVRTEKRWQEIKHAYL